MKNIFISFSTFFYFVKTKAQSNIISELLFNVDLHKKTKLGNMNHLKYKHTTFQTFFSGLADSNAPSSVQEKNRKKRNKSRRKQNNLYVRHQTNNYIYVVLRHISYYNIFKFEKTKQKRDSYSVVGSSKQYAKNKTKKTTLRINTKRNYHCQMSSASSFDFDFLTS